jgi:hypothetical protein
MAWAAFLAELPRSPSVFGRPPQLRRAPYGSRAGSHDALVSALVVVVTVRSVTGSPAVVAPVVVAVTAVLGVPGVRTPVVAPGAGTPAIVVMRGVSTGRARRGSAGSSSTTQHRGDCHAERGSKAGKTHSDLLS